jgi:hypothetical protein
MFGHELEMCAILRTLQDPGDLFSHLRDILNDNYNFRTKSIHTVGVCTRTFRHFSPEQLIQPNLLAYCTNDWFWNR